MTGIILLLTEEHVHVHTHHPLIMNIAIVMMIFTICMHILRGLQNKVSDQALPLPSPP